MSFRVHALAVLASLLAFEVAADTASQPLEFTADRLDGRRREGILKLLGNVRIDHGDTIITADQVVIFYATTDNTNKSTNKDTIERMVAAGKVRLTEPDRRGRSEHAVYEPATRKLTMTGSPVIWDLENELAGDEIVIYRDPDRLEVKRARAVVQPDKLNAVLQQPQPASESTD